VLERTVATTTPMAAVRAADLTLYRAKEEGRGRWTVFDPRRNARAVSRYAVSVRMPTAMDRGEFFIDYQPLCALPDGALVAVEALVRWRHPQLGVLGPDEFVATAEETGLIMPLGRWVLEQACGQAAEWVRRFGPAATPGWCPMSPGSCTAPGSTRGCCSWRSPRAPWWAATTSPSRP
jgi:predicted signal transduction protein with EAL and GGDEF domain